MTVRAAVAAAPQIAVSTAEAPSVERRLRSVSHVPTGSPRACSSFDIELNIELIVVFFLLKLNQLKVVKWFVVV